MIVPGPVVCGRTVPHAEGEPNPTKALGDPSITGSVQDLSHFCRALGRGGVGPEWIVGNWTIPHAEGEPNPTGAGGIAKSRELPAFAVLLAIQFAKAAHLEVAPTPQPGSATRRQRPEQAPRLPSNPARRDSARVDLPLTTAKFANPPQGRPARPTKDTPPKQSPSPRNRSPPPETTGLPTNSPTPLPPTNPRAPPKKAIPPSPYLPTTPTKPGAFRALEGHSFAITITTSRNRIACRSQPKRHGNPNEWPRTHPSGR